MMGTTRRLSVYAYARPCDMRKSFDTLAALVTQGMGRDLLGGDVFLFVGRNRKRAKALFFDGTGLCLYAKRLERGRFAAVWKRAQGEEPVALTLPELTLFFEGGEVLGRQTLSPVAAEAVLVFARARAAG
ncbi:transposase [Corallococcus sp. AB030]|uniref:IS66 family insertion sequence element accessory protein TnpB n=1 Tax=Corallococcus TaxID=83461 RepID=UPI000EE4B111|nr:MULTISPECIES: IS66 family insertion sequence element accessory protein TnpB [Corallococcus]NNB89652.1 IS66 family insertion sequence element accessory protein TnpB [Corallococcus exiguus]RKH93745.1 transposase [Corallococcus sp. AB030]